MIMMERSTTGELDELAVHLWSGPATPDERRMLDGLRPAVLDIGCGPGRIAAALAEQGVPSLGIDVAPSALRSAEGAGAVVLERSVFDPLPGEHRWGTVLLLDGNIGIGGRPLRLLARLRELTSPEGTAVVEVDPPGHRCCRDRVRLVRPGGDVGPWFDWAWVGVDDIGRLAFEAGFGSCRITRHGDRHLAHLGQPAPLAGPVP